MTGSQRGEGWGHPLDEALGRGYGRFLAEGVYRSGVAVREHPAVRPVLAEIRARGRAPWSALVEALLFGEGGYYTERVQFSTVGESGHAARDFITCPEISPLFGASFVGPLARALAQGEGGRPLPLFELGAGTGAFARAFLGELAIAAPDLYARLDYAIVERSRGLVARQRALLDAAFPGGHPVRWVHASAGEVELPEAAVVFSNEMLDCWPFERVVRQGGRLLQLFVHVEEGAWVERWEPALAEVERHVERWLPGLREGLEEPLLVTATAWLERAAQRVRRGAFCLVDYGAEGPLGPRLLGLAHMAPDKRSPVRVYGGEALEARRQTLLDEGAYVLGALIYDRLAEIDITCSVDFGAVRGTFARAGGWRVAFAGAQEVFLARAGLLARAEALRRRLREARSLGELRERAEALRFGGALVDPRMEQWFYVLLVTRGLEPILADAGADRDLATARRAYPGLELATRLARCRLPIGFGAGRVTLRRGRATAARDVGGGAVELRLDELIDPALRIEDHAGRTVFDPTRPADEQAALGAVRAALAR